MTDPRRADGFQVGDRVRVRHTGGVFAGATGMVTVFHAAWDYPYTVSLDGPRPPRPLQYRPDELELIDAQKMDRPVPADPAMPKGMARQAAGDSGGAGPAAQYPEQAEGSVPDAAFPLDVQTARLRRDVEALTKRVSRLESGESNVPA